MKIIECTQGDQAWIEARLGLPTASRFSEIMSPKELKPSKSADKYIASLVAEWLLGMPMDEAASGFMERGSEMEAEAIAWYELQRDVEVRRVGFVTTDDGRYGCSPDGLIVEGEGGPWLGGLELKCPSAAVHVSYLLGEFPHAYVPQIQGGMAVTGLPWWDFCSYHPTLPKLLVRLARDETFIGPLKKALDVFVGRLAEARQRMLDMGATAAEPYSVVAARLRAEKISTEFAGVP